MPLTLIKVMEKLSPDDFQQLLEQSRYRRLTLYTKFKQANDVKVGIECKKTREKYDKQLELLAKEITRIDKTFEKAEKRLNDIKILHNRIGQLEEMINVGTDKSEG